MEHRTETLLAIPCICKYEPEEQTGRVFPFLGAAIHELQHKFSETGAVDVLYHAPQLPLLGLLGEYLQFPI